jgi:GT2 family glycosyltransferase
MARVTIQLVTWNSQSYLPECLAGIRDQRFTDFDLTIVDNASVDGTLEVVEAAHWPRLRLLRNTRNLGFARAHNMGFRLTRSPYVLVMNPDVLLTPGTLGTLVATLDAHPECASVGAKLLRFDVLPGELREIQLTKIIDSTGLVALRSRRFLNRGEGEDDRGQWDTPGPVFGHSGSLVLYRTDALRDVAFEEEVYDASFFAYHEDADLAWRLQWAGWSAWYEPKAVAYHRREIRSARRSRDLLHAHRSRSMLINRLSFKNHALLMVKNESWRNAFFSAPWIVAREAAQIAGYAITAPKVLLTVTQIWRSLPRAIRQRRSIRKQRRVTAASIRKWFS